MYSPAVTAGGGGTVKKNFAWSAGAVKKRSAASITAKMPEIFGFTNNKASPTIGSNNPTTTKNTANAKVRSSFIRVSNPKGVNRKPAIIPNTNKTANIRFEFPRDAFLIENEDISILQNSLKENCREHLLFRVFKRK
jgi:hypothetical protein